METKNADNAAENPTESEEAKDEETDTNAEFLANLSKVCQNSGPVVIVQVNAADADAVLQWVSTDSTSDDNVAVENDNDGDNKVEQPNSFKLDGTRYHNVQLHLITCVVSARSLGIR